MSAQILRFPGTSRTVPRRPTSIGELPKGAKALVITQQRDGILVAMQPAVTPAEKAVRLTFPNADRARAYARQMAISYPRLFHAIIDQLPPRRHTLAEIMDAGWPPYDGGAAA